MSIEGLKEKARRHEQKEEWQKALDLYKQAIAKLDEQDQPDIGLYNRVGDLFVRVGNLDEAVEHYEKAVDLYVDVELPNNAIAVCKKVVRNLPDRHSIYLKMGQIRANQGFLQDARTNFLTYAERMQQAGDLDESFRALVEFCDLAPDDTDVRITVAEQMVSHDRTEEAVQQLAKAYHQLQSSGDAGKASEVEARIQELDPGFDLSAAPAEPAMAGGDDDAFTDFGDIELGGEEEAEPAAVGADDEGGVEMEDFDIASGDDEEEEVEAAEEGMAELPMMSFDDEEEEDEAEAEPAAVGADDDEGGVEMADFDIASDEEEEVEAEDEEEMAELPTMSFDEEEEDEEEMAELPTMSFDDDEEAAEAEEEEAEAEEEPAMDAAAFGEADRGEKETQEYVEGDEEMEEVEVGLSDFGSDEDEPSDAEEAREEAMEEAAAAAEEEPAAEEEELTAEEVRERLEADPDDVSLHQRNVELAYQAGDDGVLADAYTGLAKALDRDGKTTRAQAAWQQVLDADPENEEAQAALGDEGGPAQPVKEVAANEDYVDLGSMILGDEQEKSTRFQVAYEEPSGDEEADFAKMLSQFKDKVSENLGADDVKAHHDLGTAYKEMGLLDEAISEFQAALRASADHLPTYELMGQTWMEMGKPDQAVRSLSRALEVDFDVEDELVGIYYYLARAYEETGDTEHALEYYDRVFSLDINFADVTERLRALR